MGCTISEWSDIPYATVTTASKWSEANFTDLRVLVVSNNTETLTVAQARDQYAFPATGNKGLFGVNGVYHVAFVNSQPQIPMLLKQFLVPAGTGEKYWGAFGTKKVMRLAAPPVPNFAHRMILLGEYVLAESAPVMLDTSATGGGATMPYHLFFEWAPVDQEV